MEVSISMKNTNINRRTLLKGLAAIPVVAAVGYATTAAAAAVDANSDLAKTMEYTDKSTKAGEHCGNCALYQGGTAAAGPCPIFGGNDVKAAGWCKSWVAKS